MKDKIIMFVIGVLVGAVLSTGVFFLYTKMNSSNTTSTTQSQGVSDENPPEMPGGERPEMNGEEPPEKPSDENSDQTEKSSGETSKNSHSKKPTSEVTESN